MSLREEMETKAMIVVEGGDPGEILIDDSERDKSKITLPLSYDISISPVNTSSESVTVSEIIFRDTKTTIKMPGYPLPLKLKVIDQANMDNTGSSSTVSDDESGDRFSVCAVKSVDWLMPKGDSKKDGEAEKIARVIQSAKREIVIRKEKTR